jgi:hypothetical protein
MPEAQPGQQPPAPGGNIVGTARPRELTPEERAMTARTSGGLLTFPSSDETDASPVEASTTWQADARVTALWSINQNRNAYMYTQNHSTNSDIGWAKLSTASESGCVALNMLASHAKSTQARVDYRLESDGMVHEIYLW